MSLAERFGCREKGSHFRSLRGHYILCGELVPREEAVELDEDELVDRWRRAFFGLPPDRRDPDLDLLFCFFLPSLDTFESVLPCLLSNLLSPDCGLSPSGLIALAGLASYCSFSSASASINN